MNTVLPISSSVQPQLKIPFSRKNLVSASTRRNIITLKASTYVVDSPRQPEICPKLVSLRSDAVLGTYMPEEICFKSMGSVSDRNVKTVPETNERSVSIRDFGETRRERVEEGLEEEVGVVLKRLERVVERIRDLEMEKLMAGRRGELSCEERQMVESMSNGIVNSFLEKPMQYLKRRDVKLEEKIRDLNFLVRLLEQSSLEDRTKCSNRRLKV